MRANGKPSLEVEFADLEENKLMIKNYKIPIIYQKMEERGYTTQENYLWLNEMEWMSINQISQYEYDEGESELLIPFAFTGGGDKWVWIVNDENKDYCVGLCEDGEINGIYYAKNTEDAIFRQIIEYISDSNFYVCESKAKSYQISETKLTQLLEIWKNGFKEILNDNYIQIIDNVSKLRLKHTKSQYGEWEALLTLDEKNEILNRYIKFDLLDKEFEWYIK